MKEPEERASGRGVVLAAGFIVLVSLLALAPGTRRLSMPMFLAGVALLAIIGTGDAAFRLGRRVVATDDEKPSNATLAIIGYPLFGAVCFSVSSVMISAATSVALLAIPAVWGALTVRRGGEAAGLTPRLAWPTRLLLSVAAALAFLLTQLPASTLDELAYHLAVPMTWVTHGRVIELPLLSHSYFPFAIESADVPLLSLGGQHAGALASHFLHLFVAVAIVTMMLQRVVRESSLAVAAIISTPALLIIVGWSWIDVPLVGLALVLLCALDEEKPALATLAVAGGLLTKYTFAPLALALLACAFFRTRDRSSIVKVALTGGVLGSLFFVRNLLLTGNPVYPMFTASGAETIGYRGEPSLAGIARYVYDPRFFDETIGIALFVLAVLAVLRSVRSGATFRRDAAIVLAALLLAIAYLAPSSRVLLPFAVPLAFLAAREPFARGVRVALYAVSLLQLFLVAVYTNALNPLSLLEAKSDERYLEQTRRAYAPIRFADSALPAQSRTLVLGTQELFWFSHDVRGGGNFDGSRIAAYLSAPSPDTLLQRLRRDEYTHVVVIAGGIRVGTASKDVKRRERELALPHATAANLQRFLRMRTTLLARQGDVTVHALSTR